MERVPLMIGGALVGGVLGVIIGAKTFAKDVKPSSEIPSANGEAPPLPSAEVDELREQLKGSQDIRNSFDKQTKEIEQQKLESSKLKYEWEQINKKFAQKVEEEKAERAKHAHTKDELQKASVDLAKTHTIVTKLHKEKEELHTESVHLKNETAALKKEIEALRHVQNDEERKIGQTEAELQKLKKSYEEYQQYKTEQAALEQSLRKELDAKSDIASKLQEDLIKTLDQQSLLKGELQMLQQAGSEADALRREAASLQNRVKDLEEENGTVKQQMFLVEKNLNEAITQKNEEIGDLTQLLKQKEAEVVDLTIQLRKLEAGEQ